MKTASTNSPIKSMVGISLYLALAIVLCLPTLTGCSSTADSTDGAGAQASVQMAVPATVNKAVVLDSTSSTDPQFCESVRSSLADELGGWGGSPESNITDGADRIPGLELWVFIVGDNPTASFSAKSLHISLPGIEGLSARPGLGDEDALNAIQAWNKEKDRYEGDLTAWQAARDAAVAELQGFNLSTDQYSGIFSTIAAASLNVAPSTDVLLASDLQNNKDPQPGGDLSGSKVYVLQATPSGDMAEADSLYGTAVSYLETLGVAEQDIYRYRVEQTPDAVHAFMYGA